MEKHNKIAPPMGSTQSLEESADTKAANSRYIIEKMKELDDGSTQFIQGLPYRLHEINALMKLASFALHDEKHRDAALEVLNLASSKLEDLEDDAVNTAEGKAA